MGAALVLGGFAAVDAHAQSQSDTKYANVTITLATTANGDDSLHFSSVGCDGNLSGVGIFVDIDGSCWAWNSGGDVPRSMWTRIAPSKISFRHDGKDYVITDAATVKRARGLFAPLTAILERQNTLGDQERALGEKQRNVKVPVPDMNADFEKVEADAKRLSAEGGRQSELGEVQSELGDLQSRLGDLQSQAGDAQSKLGDQQSVLGDRQSSLGDQAKEIAPGIAGKLRDILNQSVQNGAAKPE
jgi:hypothetical protein